MHQFFIFVSLILLHPSAHLPIPINAALQSASLFSLTNTKCSLHKSHNASTHFFPANKYAFDLHLSPSSSSMSHLFGVNGFSCVFKIGGIGFSCVVFFLVCKFGFFHSIAVCVLKNWLVDLNNSEMWNKENSFSFGLFC